MIHAYDSEFHEDGRTIDLISIGIVCEDGREYYAVNADAGWDRIAKHDWLRENVVPSLPVQLGRNVKRYEGFTKEQPAIKVDMHDPSVKPKWVIANEVREFLLADGAPELWADYGAYDHVVLCQLWGRMIDLPDGMPMVTRDLQQELARTGAAVPEQAAGAHNALEDARHVMHCLRHLGIVRTEAA